MQPALGWSKLQPVSSTPEPTTATATEAMFLIMILWIPGTS